MRHELGTVVLSRSQEVLAARRKIAELLHGLGLTRTKWAAIASAVSDLGRTVCQNGNPCELRVSILPTPDISKLYFELTTAAPFGPRLPYFSVFSDHLVLGSEGSHTLQLTVKLLGRRFEPALLASLAETFQQPTHEQLFEQLKSANAKLEQAKAAAEAASVAKGNFLAAMSHEIRTPINAVLNMTQLALEAELPSKVVRYLEVARSSGATLLALINDILDHSKIEASKLVLESIPFQLDRLLNEVTSSFHFQARQKRLDLTLNCEPDVPLLVIGDSLRIRQVLLNLISNAIKFTDAGEVAIRVTAKEAANGAVVRFSVRDSGIGITPEQQQRLFQSFAQLDSSITRRFGGSGLGLSISKRLVELMGGALGCESRAGEGSEFFFSIPFSGPMGRFHETAPRAWFARLSGPVLLVIDGTALADQITGLLAQVGIGTRVAANLAGSFSELSQKERPAPGLILVRDRLCQDNPRAAVQQLRAAAGGRTCVVMVTDRALQTAEEQTAQAGADGFLSAPFTGPEFYDGLKLIFAPDEAKALELKGASTPGRDDQLGASLAGCRLIVAEDNATNQFVIQELLQPLGIKLTMADNGLEVLQLLEKEDQPDAILMDMQMPEMDGLTATAEIRRRWPKLRMPIVALTANALEEDRERCLAAGMNCHLPKPIERTALLEVLTKLLRRVGPNSRAEPVADVTAKQAPPVQERPQGDPKAPAWDGVEVEKAMRRLGATWPAFERILKRFVESCPAQLEQLRAALAKEDWEAARRHAHTFSGAAGNLGAESVRAAAQALELALVGKTGEYASLTRSLDLEVARLVRGNGSSAATSDVPRGGS